MVTIVVMTGESQNKVCIVFLKENILVIVFNSISLKSFNLSKKNHPMNITLKLLN